MRIGHFLNSIHLASGGPRVVVKALAEVQARNNEVVVFTNNHCDDIHDFDCNVVFFDFSNNIFAYLRQNNLHIEKAISGLDAVHIHGYWTPFLHFVAKTCLKKRVPFVLTPHGMLHPWSMAQKKFKKKVVQNLILKRSLLRANVLHALNENERSVLENLGLSRNEIAVIPNGVPSQLLKSTDLEKKINGNEPFLFLGRLHYKKGLRLLLNGYSQYLKEGGVRRLEIVGPDDGEGNALNSAIEKIPLLASKVDIMGPVYGMEKARVLSSAGCFVLPSMQEGFSIAILEAIGNRLPVLITDECNFPEIFTYKAGLRIEFEARSLSTAMHQYDNLTFDEKLVMGNNGRNLVENCYTWDKICVKFEELYSSLIKMPLEVE